MASGTFLTAKVGSSSAPFAGSWAGGGGAGSPAGGCATSGLRSTLQAARQSTAGTRTRRGARGEETLDARWSGIAAPRAGPRKLSYIAGNSCRPGRDGWYDRRSTLALPCGFAVRLEVENARAAPRPPRRQLRPQGRRGVVLPGPAAHAARGRPGLLPHGPREAAQLRQH